MYTCIQDPETGRRLYADIKVETRTTVCPKSAACDVVVAQVKTADVVTEAEFSEVIAWELRGAIIRGGPLLSWVMKEVFNIAAEACPGLVSAVEERLKEVRFGGVIP